jgi:hypothetical protein
MLTLLLRSLPGAISAGGVPPVDTAPEDNQDSTTAMAKKTPPKPVLLPILVPIAIALAVYVVLFHVLLPTWRAHRERYRQVRTHHKEAPPQHEPNPN